MSSNKITVDEVKRVAKLARIKLTADEETTFTVQLSPVLEHIDHLNRLDTTDVSPTAQVTGLKNIFQNIPGISFSQKEALSTAAKTTDGYIIAPQSIDK